MKIGISPLEELEDPLQLLKLGGEYIIADHPDRKEMAKTTTRPDQVSKTTVTLTVTESGTKLATTTPVQTPRPQP
jgi:hypothetical protein